MNLAVPPQSNAAIGHYGPFSTEYTSIMGKNSDGVISTSRISIARITLPDSVYMKALDFDAVTFSDKLTKATSWILFKYETENIFHGRYSGYSNDRVLFNDVSVIQKVGLTGNSLKVIESGIYFITLSIGSKRSFEKLFTLYLNGKPLYNDFGKIFSGSTQTDGTPHVVSRSWIMQLREGDELFVFKTGSNFDLVSKYHTSFSLFRLNANIEKPAFCAIRTIGWNGTSATAPLNPIEFDEVLLHIGNYWNPRENYYKIHTPGVYFLSLTAGSDRNSRLEIEIFVNEENIGELIHLDTKDVGIQTVAKTMLLKVKKDDIIKFSAVERSMIEPTHKLTTISIFYLNDINVN